MEFGTPGKSLENRIRILEVNNILIYENSLANILW